VRAGHGGDARVVALVPTTLPCTWHAPMNVVWICPRPHQGRHMLHQNQRHVQLQQNPRHRLPADHVCAGSHRRRLPPSGECYHCSEKYTADHKCAARGVFLLELDGEDTGTTDTLAEKLGISLHALTGIDIADTLKLKVSINGVALIALVDSGSTHTFIQDAIVPRLGLHVTPTAGLPVKVANGEKVLSGASVLKPHSLSAKRILPQPATLFPWMALMWCLG
jgi:hypothetical protein